MTFGGCFWKQLYRWFIRLHNCDNVHKFNSLNSKGIIILSLCVMLIQYLFKNIYRDKTIVEDKKNMFHGLLI